MFQPLRVFIFLFFVSFIHLSTAQSTIQSNGTGNWNTGGTWVGGVVPGINDSVVINNTHTVTIDMPGVGNSKCKSLNVLNGGIVEYRSSAAATLQVSNSVTIATGGTLRTASGTNITGHRLEVGGSVSNSATFNLNRNTLVLGGSLTGSGTTTADSIYTYIECSGSSSQTINTTFNNSKIANLKIYNATSITGSITISNSILLYSGTLSCSGTFTLGNAGSNNFTYERRDGSQPTITQNYGSGTNNFTYSGTSAQTTGGELPSSVATGTLTISNSSGVGNGVTLNAALSIEKLDMQNGTLNTSSTNLLTISSTNYNAVTRTGGWVNGPLKRTIPYGLVYVDRNRIYLFPVGKSTYSGFEMVSPTTRNTATFTCNSNVLANTSATVEAFDANAGGSGGSNFTSLASNRYWKYVIGSPTCIFFSSGIRVFDSTSTDTSTMGICGTSNGTYNNIGGFYYSNTVGGTQPVFASLYSNTMYICLGGKPNLAGGTYTVGHSGKNYQSLTSVANILHSRILTGNVIFEVYDNYAASDEIFPLIFWPFVVRNGDWNVTIRPNSGNSSDLLTNGDPSSSTWHANYWPLLTFEGTRNLTFDGRKGGTGSTSAWTFRDESTTAIGPVVEFINDARNDTIKYLILEGQNNNGGSVHIAGSSYSVGNDSNCIYYNTIRRRSDVSGQAYLYGVHMSGGVTTPKNDHTLIEGNYIENANLKEIYVLDSGMGNYLSIKNNHLYHSVNISTSGTGIELQTKQGPKYIEIIGNYIGGSQPNCGGSYWVNSANSGQLRGVKLNTDTLNTLVFHNNHIKSFKMTGTNAIYYGMDINNGKIDITHNEIGDTSLDSSISTWTGSNVYGISADSFTNLNIYKNTIGGIYNRNNANNSTTCGIRLISVFRPHIESNGIGRIKFGPATTVNGGLNIYGLYHSATRYMDSMFINRNTIANLAIADAGTGGSVCRGMYLNTSGGTTGYVNYNLVNYLSNSSTSATSSITGIYLDEGHFKLSNNMVVIKNENNTNTTDVDGIIDNTSGGRQVSLYYNSVLVGGSQSSGSNSSHAFRRLVGSTTTLRNNLLYNKRSGGSGNHIGIGNIVSTPTNGWGATASMHNLITVSDTSKVTMWNTTMKNNTNFRASSAGDSTSWIYTTSQLPSDSLFTNENINLNIKSTSDYCWLANGKGQQVPSIYPGDLNDSSTFRNTVVINGSTDIGADEFTPASYTSPPQLYVTGSHTTNGTEIFWQGGRKIFEITWANTGTLPTFNNYQYYTGKWPNDSTNGSHIGSARYMNTYIKIDTSGSSNGSNYQYTMKFYYDDALLGRINTESSMILVKKKVNVASTWDTIRTSTRNTFANTISTSGTKLRSFSEFTLTEDNSFALPLIFTDYYIENNGEAMPQLVWQVNNEQDVDYYQIKQLVGKEEKLLSSLPSLGNAGSRPYKFQIDNVPACYKIEALSKQEVADQTIYKCYQKNNINTTHIFALGNVLYVETANDFISNENCIVKVYNMQGNLVKYISTGIKSNATKMLDISGCSEGIYMVVVEDGQREWVQKIPVLK